MDQEITTHYGDTADLAVVAITPYYGPREEYSLVAVGEETQRAEMQAYADAYAPNYDEDVHATRLGHNQSAGTRAEVLVIVLEGNDLSSDWGVLPADLEAALIARYPDGNTDEDENNVYEAAGYLLLADSDGIEYLIKR